MNLAGMIGRLVNQPFFCIFGYLDFLVYLNEIDIGNLRVEIENQIGKRWISHVVIFPSQRIDGLSLPYCYNLCEYTLFMFRGSENQTGGK